MTRLSSLLALYRALVCKDNLETDVAKSILTQEILYDIKPHPNS